MGLLTQVVFLLSATWVSTSLTSGAIMANQSLELAVQVLSSSQGSFNPDPNAIFPLVTTPLGKLRGQTLKSREGKLYYAFQGIPYAQKPNRFEAAKPVKAWGGLRDARQFGSVCAQVDPVNVGKYVGSEDCLFINVYFPHQDRCQNASESGQLPVLLHIHGGGFIIGAGSNQGAKYILDTCTLFVTINYRLGSLGFLSTGDDVIPGNLGLKDQVLALKWTKEFISYFRGNPDKVTITGISGGGSSVSHHVASPMAKGLFASAITESAGVLVPWAIYELPAKYATSLGNHVGCSSDGTSQDLKSCLQSKSVDEILKHQQDDQIFSFGPTIEPSSAADPFQTKNPAIVMKNGEFNLVPLIIGFTANESINILAGPLLANPAMMSVFNNSWMQTAPSWLFYGDLGIPQNELDRISRDIRQFYFGNQSIGGQETREQFIKLLSDRCFYNGIFQEVETHSKYAPVYAYVMTYKGGSTGAVNYGYEVPVISHGDDGQYLYYPTYEGFPEFAVGSEQYEFSTRLVHHWTEFTRTGRPGVSRGDPWWPTNGQLVHHLDLVEKNQLFYMGERTTSFWKNLGLSKYEEN